MLVVNTFLLDIKTHQVAQLQCPIAGRKHEIPVAIVNDDDIAVRIEPAATQLPQAAAEIDKRFVEYLLESSDGVTDRIIEVLRRAAFQALADKSQKWGCRNFNMSARKCHPSSADGNKFAFRTSLRRKRRYLRKADSHKVRALTHGQVAKVPITGRLYNSVLDPVAR